MTDQELQEAMARTDADKKLRDEIAAAETAMINAEIKLKAVRKKHADQSAKWAVGAP
jgi:hypothetical protein